MHLDGMKHSCQNTSEGCDVECQILFCKSFFPLKKNKKYQLQIIYDRAI